MTDITRVVALEMVPLYATSAAMKCENNKTENNKTSALALCMLIGCGNGSVGNSALGLAAGDGGLPANSIAFTRVGATVNPGRLLAATTTLARTTAAATPFLGSDARTWDFSRKWIVAVRPATAQSNDSVEVARISRSNDGRTLTLAVVLVRPAAGCPTYERRPTDVVYIAPQSRVPSTLQTTTTVLIESCGRSVGAACRSGGCPSGSQCNGAEIGAGRRCETYANIEGDQASCGAAVACRSTLFCDDDTCRPTWQRASFDAPSTGSLNLRIRAGAAAISIPFSVNYLATVSTSVRLRLWAQTQARQLTATLENPNGTIAPIDISSGVLTQATAIVGFPGDESVNGVWRLRVSVPAGAADVTIDAAQLSLTSRWD